MERDADIALPEPSGSDMPWVSPSCDFITAVHPIALLQALLRVGVGAYDKAPEPVRFRALAIVLEVPAFADDPQRPMVRW